MKKVRFSGQSAFYNTLKNKVDEYFKTSNRSQKGGLFLLIKSLIILSGFIGSYVFIVFYASNIWQTILALFVCSQFCAMIGFSIEHDGNHGSFSKYKFVNFMAGASLDFIGASSTLWRQKHNHLHHTFTNIDGIDDDLDASVFLRLAPNQERKPWHKFQAFYFPLIYGLLSIYWVYFIDFKKFFTGKIGDFQLPKMTLKQRIFFLISKVFFVSYTIIIPSFFHDFGNVLLANFSFLFVVGFTMSIIFNLAHVMESREFFDTSEERMEHDWAEHQVRTTANFATRNPLLTWFSGGLNYQIEHHLFPKIAHIHYPKIRKIVKETCEEFGLKYQEEKFFLIAIFKHIRFLHKLSKPAFN